MSDLGKLPTGLMRDIGSDLFWAVARSEIRVNPSTGEMIMVFPLLNGIMIMEITKIDGTGSVG